MGGRGREGDEGKEREGMEEGRGKGTEGMGEDMGRDGEGREREGREGKGVEDSWRPTGCILKLEGLCNSRRRRRTMWSADINIGNIATHPHPHPHTHTNTRTP